MSRYDQNQLKEALAGATPLQSLAGKEPVMNKVMAQLGIENTAPKPMAPAPAAPANTAEAFLGAPQPSGPGGMS